MGEEPYMVTSTSRDDIWRPVLNVMDRVFVGETLSVACLIIT